jgi:ATP-dependent Clp protease protease subunit
MQFIQPDVATYCVGQAASIAALLLAAGKKGKRFALPNSRILLHQPWGAARGTAKDIKIQAEEIIKIKKRINELLHKHTGQPLEKIEKDADRDFYIGPQEAKEYGIIDEIIVPKK